MRVRLCGQEDILEVEESLGRRLCEQGKAVPGDAGRLGDRGIVPEGNPLGEPHRESGLVRNDMDDSERAGNRGPSSTTATRRSHFPVGEGCGETEGRTARKRGKRNGACGEDKDGQ